MMSLPSAVIFAPSPINAWVVSTSTTTAADTPALRSSSETATLPAAASITVLLFAATTTLPSAATSALPKGAGSANGSTPMNARVPVTFTTTPAPPATAFDLPKPMLATSEKIFSEESAPTVMLPPALTIVGISASSDAAIYASDDLVTTTTSRPAPKPTSSLLPASAPAKFATRVSLLAPTSMSPPALTLAPELMDARDLDVSTLTATEPAIARAPEPMAAPATRVVTPIPVSPIAGSSTFNGVSDV